MNGSRTVRSDRAAWLFAVLTLAAFLPFAPWYLSARFNGIDFEAFYCAGAVVAGGGNPYLQEPLHRCEARVHWTTDRNALVVPAPLPPPVLAAYVPLALMPYPLARALWCALGVAALAGAVVLLVRLFDAPPFATALVVVMSNVLALTLGQVIPLCLLGMLLIAYGLRTRRGWACALGTVVLVPQPAIALPVAAALLMFGGRRVAAWTCVALAFVTVSSLTIAGWSANLAYVRTILPLQAYAELPNDTQLSLSGLLAQHGVSAPVALALGTASYVLCVVAGVWAARSLARRFHDDAMLAVVPPAFAVFLGTYVHLQLYALAVPLALVVACRSTSMWPRYVLFGIALPWHWIAMTLYLIPSFAVMSCAYALGVLRASLVRAAIFALGIAASLFALALWYVHGAPPHLPPFVYRADPTALVEYTWVAVERTYGMIGEGPAVDVLRLLSIVPLGALLGIALRRTAIREVRGTA